jgi:hypothetical protein
MLPDPGVPARAGRPDGSSVGQRGLADEERQVESEVAKRLVESPELLSNPALRPLAARYKLALKGIDDPDSARALLGLKSSRFRKPL